MEKDKVKIGIIGCGYWGPNLIRVFNEIESCHVKFVCDLKQERLANISRKYQHTNVTDNHNALLNDKDLDAVIISTPVSTHYRLAKEALLKNKHVFVEKPLSDSSAEGEELVSIAEKQGKVLMVGHTFLYSPPVTKVKELIKDNTVGNIYYIDSSRVNLGLFQPDVSVIWDLGPHDVSIILHWLDAEPIAVNAIGSSYVQRNIDEVSFIALKFGNGIIAHINISWLAPCKLRRTTIVGSKNMVVYDDTESVEKVKIYDQGVVKNPEDFGEFQLTYRSGDIVSPHINNTEPLKLECLDFLAAIQTGKKPESDGKFGLKVVKVLEAAQESLKNKGAAISLNK